MRSTRKKRLFSACSTSAGLRPPAEGTAGAVVPRAAGTLGDRFDKLKSTRLGLEAGEFVVGRWKLAAEDGEFFAMDISVPLVKLRRWSDERRYTAGTGPAVADGCVPAPNDNGDRS